MSEEEEMRCLVSHPAQPHTLSRRVGLFPPSGCFACGRKRRSLWGYNIHYHCTTCKVEFHRDCHWRPRKITHPYHLQHPLTLVKIEDVSDDSSTSESDTSDLVANSQVISLYRGKPETERIIQSKPSIFVKCNWCGEDLGNLFYRCSICSFCLDIPCSTKSPLLTITNPKCHHHSLFFFPRPLLVPCDACGVASALAPGYVCLQCNYMVHQSCIDLPRVIKITRHLHRLSYTPYLPPTVSPCCKVCYKAVDFKYGQYSCNHDGCSYVAHSHCASHELVWDGKELEWEPEEPDESEDIAPFKQLDGGLIKHFCHEHHLKLQNFIGHGHVEKKCQACILPIYLHDFYECVECDFSLHEVCANLPRKLNHALHIHPLFLDPSPKDNNGSISCSVCSQKSTGFKYKCMEEECEVQRSQFQFQVDIRCILVGTYFTHKSHEHPLFISTFRTTHDDIFCKVCKEICYTAYLQCTLCDYTMCYRCTTIPEELSCKYDDHPLSLSYGEEADNKYWCQMCEKEVNSTEWFYTCNICCITIHLGCIFRSSLFIKAGFTFFYTNSIVTVLRNSSSTRPICGVCDERCPDSIYIKPHNWLPICSMDCVETAINS